MEDILRKYATAEVGVGAVQIYLLSKELRLTHCNNGGTRWCREGDGAAMAHEVRNPAPGSALSNAPIRPKMAGRADKGAGLRSA